MSFMSDGMAAHPPAVIASVPSAQKIRVRLAEAIPKVSVRGFDLNIFEAHEGKTLAAHLDRVSEWEVRCQDGRVRLLASQGGKSLDLKEPVLLESPTGFLNFRSHPYRQVLQIHSVGSLCEVVNVVDLEEYLDGLVNSEFSSKWNEESIAAQVVAARTYAWFQIKKAQKDLKARFDVDATTRDQVYDGSVKEDPRSSRTVDRTRGLVLTVNQGQEPSPLKAFYHSTCGGVTELPEHVWGSTFPGFKRSVKCPYCSSSPRFRWQLDLHSSEVAQSMLRGARSEGAAQGWPKDWLSYLRDGKLTHIRVVGLDPEQRVAKVATVWVRGKETIELNVSGPRIRDWLGVTQLKSTAFQVTEHRGTGGQRWRFEGRGNGHGVGMCQWGAKVMGEKGHSMAAILKHYYPDAKLSKLW